MLLYPAFFRKHGIRRLGQMVKPPMGSINNLIMPRESVLHYLSDGPADFGIIAEDPLLNGVEKIVMVDHVTELRSEVGNPRPKIVSAPSMIRDYHRKNRKMRPLRKMETALRDPKTLIVINYAMLPHLYRYVNNFFIEHYRWTNINTTLWEKVNELAIQTNRQQFVSMKLPKFLPSVAQMTRGEGGITRQVLDTFNDDEMLNILDLWIWLGDKRSSSTMSKLSPEALDKVNIIWSEAGRFFVMNLGVINQWRQIGEADVVVEGVEGGTLPAARAQRAFLKMLMSLYEVRTLGASAETVEQFEESGDSEELPSKVEDGHEIDTSEDSATFAETIESSAATDELIDDVDDLDIVVETLNKRSEAQVLATVYNPPVDNLENGIQESADKMVDLGLLSAAEYRRIGKLAQRYKEIENPYGKGTLEDLITISHEDTAIPLVSKMVEDLNGVTDKSMLNNTTDIMDKKYIKKIYHKDIAASVVAIQKAGIAVQNYKVERVDEFLNSYEIHTVKVVPVVGSPSTVRFRVPVIEEDGTFKANGVKYHLRKQRGDMPIRKTSSMEVALTSYYGKLFITRSDRSTHNYEKWLTNNISTRGLDIADLSVTELRFSDVFMSEQKLPHVYSILAKSFASFISKEYFLYFNFAKRIEKFGEARVERAEYRSSKNNHNLIVCGTKGKDALLLMDPAGFIYSFREGLDLKEEGTVESIIGLPLENRPVEILEIGIFGKPVPLGFVLAYEVGINNLVKHLKLEPRRVGRGERLNLTEDEFAVRFEDEALIFERGNKLAEYIFGGFNRFHRDIKRYSLYDFDKKDVYQVILDRNGLGARYVREMDMLYKMFVDPITKELLIEISEPTDMVGLFLRAADLLMTDDYPHYSDMAYMRDKGYERIPGMIYAEMIRSLRAYKAKPATSSSSLDVNPQAIWQHVLQDPAGKPIEESNPISNLKQKEVIVFSGEGGRNSRSMTAKHRQYHKSNIGNTSEATPDSGDVATIIYLSADPKYVSVRGRVAPYDAAVDGPARIVSPSMMITPGADRDD